MRTLKRFAAKRAAAMTVVSTAMLHPIEELRIASTRVEVRPMGVDLDRFAPNPKVSRSSRDLLFVGRLVEKKGVRYLLEAMPCVLASFPDVRLTIAGFGPEREALEQLAERLGLVDSVEFLGAIPQQKLPDYYRRATALIAPFVQAADGDQEGLGLVVVEALVCGCPVVTTEIAAVREVFGGRSPEYCAYPGSPESLASEITRLLGNIEAARAGVSAMLTGLQARFGWEAVASGYAELLKGVVLNEDQQA